MDKSVSTEPSYLTEFLVGLLNAPSPTGLAAPAVEYTASALRSLDLDPRPTPKGRLLAEWRGRSSQAAHVDMLGPMVKEIMEMGRIKLAQRCGYAWTRCGCLPQS